MYVCRNWPFLPMSLKVKKKKKHIYIYISHSVYSDSLRPHGMYPERLLWPWNSQGKNSTVGCHFLLPGIFPTQGWSPGLLPSRQILYHLRHQGCPTTNFLKEASQEMISSLFRIWSWWGCKTCFWSFVNQ